MLPVKAETALTTIPKLSAEIVPELLMRPEKVVILMIEIFQPMSPPAMLPELVMPPEKVEAPTQTSPKPFRRP